MDVVYTWWSCLFVLLLNENAKKEEKKRGLRKLWNECKPEVENEFSKLKLKGIWSCQEMNGSLREKSIN